MPLELFIAFRYLKARRKQAVLSLVTAISVLGVMAGVAALNVALALNSGFQSEFQKRILGATSHVNLMGAGNSSLVGFRLLAEQLAELPEVTEVSPTVYGQALLQSDLRQQPAVLKGIDLSARGVRDDLLDKIREGNLDDFGTADGLPGILLGKDLAEGLGVLAGETIRALGAGGELSPLGRMPRSRNYRVAGIFETGLWEYDANWALIPLDVAQAFFNLSPHEVSALEFRIRDIYAADTVARQIRQEAGPGYTTSTWIQLNWPLFSALRLEKLAMFVAIGLIVLVASLNIVSNLTLMVMDKHRDIAIITAMGGTARTVMRVFMLQGLIIGIIGTVLGDIAGSAAVWYFDTYQVFRLEPQVYSIPYVPFQQNLSDLLLISAVAVLISFLATIFPARSAARLDPVEALRHE